VLEGGSILTYMKATLMNGLRMQFKPMK